MQAVPGKKLKAESAPVSLANRAHDPALDCQARGGIYITEAALWYESHESGLGLELIAEIQAAIGRALNDPEMFPRLRKIPNVRRILARRFPL